MSVCKNQDVDISGLQKHVSWLVMVLLSTFRIVSTWVNIYFSGLTSFSSGYILQNIYDKCTIQKNTAFSLPDYISVPLDLPKSFGFARQFGFNLAELRPCDL